MNGSIEHAKQSCFVFSRINSGVERVHDDSCASFPLRFNLTLFGIENRYCK